MAKIQLNGKKVLIKSKFSIYDLLIKYKLNTKKIAIEYNGEIIPKERYKSKFLKDKDKIEIVHFIGEDDLKKDTLIIANKKFNLDS